MYRLPKEIEAVIFDLDGTLIDSTAVWKQVDIEYMEQKGLEVPEDLQEKIEGMSFTEVARYVKERFQITDTVEEMIDIWHKMAMEHYEFHIPMKRGAVEFVKELKKMGFKLGIGTSNSRKLTDVVLHRYGLLPFFDTIRTSCEVEKGKPHPDVYLKVAEDLQCDPKHCLVFEDTLSGIVSATRAQMQVIGIQDAFSIHNESEIRKYTLSYIKNFEELK